MRILGLALLLWSAGASQTAAQRLETVKVESSDGGSMGISFGNLSLNANSSMHRSWLTVNDMACPAQIVNAGIAVEPSPRATYLQYVPSIARVVTAAPVSVLEVRFLLYDVFGDPITTLREVRVEDFASAGTFPWRPAPAPPPAPVKKGKKAEAEERPPGVWEAPINDARRLQTVVSFVARVKTSDGKIWNFDSKAVSEGLTKALGKTIPETALEAK